MKMVNRLTRVSTRIRSYSVAALDDSSATSNLHRGLNETARQIGNVLNSIVQRDKVLIRNHQDVDFRLRVNVAKRRDLLVGVDDVSVGVSRDDSAKDAVGYHHFSFLRHAWVYTHGDCENVQNA